MDDNKPGKVLRVVADVLDPPETSAVNQRNEAAQTLQKEAPKSSSYPSARGKARETVRNESGHTRKEISDMITPTSMQKRKIEESEDDFEGITNEQVKLRKKFEYEPFSLQQAAKTLTMDYLACERLLDEYVREDYAITFGSAESKRWVMRKP